MNAKWLAICVMVGNYLLLYSEGWNTSPHRVPHLVLMGAAFLALPFIVNAEERKRDRSPHD